MDDREVRVGRVDTLRVLGDKKLLMGDDIRDMLDFAERLFFGEDILDIERFLARYSADFLVCERALWGI